MDVEDAEWVLWLPVSPEWARPACLVVDDPDDWYAAMVVLMRERAPA